MIHLVERVVQRPHHCFITDINQCTKVCHQIKGSPFLKCVVSTFIIYGHCPNSFRLPRPPPVKQAPCQNELKSAKTILASGLNPPLKQEIAHLEVKRVLQFRQALTPS